MMDEPAVPDDRPLVIRLSIIGLGTDSVDRELPQFGPSRRIA